MPVDQILPLMGLILVMTGTPGPNNLMLMTSGAKFGFRRSIPHILGIIVGCQTLLLGMALGLDGLLQRYPATNQLLRLACLLALLYLAWLLVRPEMKTRTPANATKEVSGHPLRFWQAAAFQWVNPKAWMMMVAALGAYTQRDNMVGSVLIIALLFAVISLPVIGFWNLSGAALQRWLQASPRRSVRFNWLMAALLLATLYPLLS